MKPYEADKVRAIREGVEPRDLRKIVGPMGRYILNRLRETVLKTQSELDQTPPADFVKPYLDPRLRDPAAMKELCDKLGRAGLLTYRKENRCNIGCFTVSKKDGSLRLIFDCRPMSALCRPAPHTELSTPGALSNLELSSAEEARGPEDRPLELSFAGLDLTDGFYQLGLEDLSSYFCLGITVSAQEVNVSEVLDELSGEQVPVAPSEKLWPCLRVLPVGWGWSLWFCQDVLADTMVTAESQRRGVSKEEVENTQLLVDRRPPPSLRPGRPILAPYVDNGNLICWSASESREVYQSLAAETRRRRLAFKDDFEGELEVQVLGLHLDGRRLLLRNRDVRVWRQYYALHALVRQSCSGRVLQVVAGNVVNFFMVARPALSALCHIWRRAAELGDEVGPLGAKVRDELRLAAGLTLIAERSWVRPPAPVLFLSDSSMHGFALMTSSVDAHGRRQVTQWAERWRFREAIGETVCVPSTAHRGRAAEVEELAPKFEAWVEQQKPVSDAKSSRRQTTRVRTEYETDSEWVPPLPESLLVSHRWKPVLAGGWRYSGAIHAKECRVSLLGLSTLR